MKFKVIPGISMQDKRGDHRKGVSDAPK